MKSVIQNRQNAYLEQRERKQSTKKLSPNQPKQSAVRNRSVSFIKHRKPPSLSSSTMKKNGGKRHRRKTNRRK